MHTLHSSNSWIDELTIIDYNCTRFSIQNLNRILTIDKKKNFGTKVPSQLSLNDTRWRLIQLFLSNSFINQSCNCRDTEVHFSRNSSVHETFASNAYASILCHDTSIKDVSCTNALILLCTRLYMYTWNDSIAYVHLSNTMLRGQYCPSSW